MPQGHDITLLGGLAGRGAEVSVSSSLSEGGKHTKMKYNCFGICYICCNKKCDLEESCKMTYQEEIAIPRLEKEMLKNEILGENQ